MKLIFILTYLFFCSFIGVAQDVPRVISYQGVLVGADGKPVNGVKDITFRLQEKSGSPEVMWIETIPDVNINGGLFSVPLGLTSNPKGFPILNGEYALEVSIDGKPFEIPLYSTVSALNIADNVVTSAKIKDGEVKAIDIGDNEVVKSIKGLKDAIEIVAGNPNIRIKVDGQNILVEGKDTVKAAEQLIGGIPSGVPVGTIVAFYGLTSQVHPDWLVCNGDYVNQSSYPDLFNHLNTLYGSSKLPDLRGMFLRGADLGLGNDPDSSIAQGKRSYPTGVGDNIEKIGSSQQDAFQFHQHEVWQNQQAGSGGWWDLGSGAATQTSNYNDFLILAGETRRIIAGHFEKNLGNPRLSTETRPKNVYVNYIIKAR